MLECESARDIDPTQIITIEDCDYAMQFVLEECIHIEGQLGAFRAGEIFPDDLSWPRRAKMALKYLCAKRQALAVRRGVLTRELSQQSKRQNIAASAKQTETHAECFVLAAKQHLSNVDYLAIWASARKLMEPNKITDSKDEKSNG